MLPVLAAVFFFCVAVPDQASTLTLTQIHENLHVEARKLVDYEDEWDLKILDKRRIPTSKIVQHRFLDGSRCLVKTTINGLDRIIQGSDGNTTFACNLPKQQFATLDAPHYLYGAKYVAPKEREKFGMNVLLEGPWDFVFSSKPEVEVRQVVNETLDGRAVRKIVLDGDDRREGANARITIWVDEKRWVLRRFDAECFYPDGAIYVEGRQTICREPASIPATTFELSAKTRADFKRIDWTSFWRTMES